MGLYLRVLEVLPPDRPFLYQMPDPVPTLYLFFGLTPPAPSLPAPPFSSPPPPSFPRLLVKLSFTFLSLSPLVLLPFILLNAEL